MLTTVKNDKNSKVGLCTRFCMIMQSWFFPYISSLLTIIYGFAQCISTGHVCRSLYARVNMFFLTNLIDQSHFQSDICFCGSRPQAGAKESLPVPLDLPRQHLKVDKKYLVPWVPCDPTKLHALLCHCDPNALFVFKSQT